MDKGDKGTFIAQKLAIISAQSSIIDNRYCFLSTSNDELLVERADLFMCDGH